MADMAMGIGFNAVPIVTNHYNKITDPLLHRYNKARGKLPKDDPDVVDSRTMEDKGYVLRKRSEVAPNEQIVEVVRHRGEVVPRRPRNSRRRSSMDNARDDYRGGGGYDSESSVPPRSRVRARSQGGRSRKRGSSSSSTSSSDLGSSSDEREKCKKIKRKKWLTAALASVATIHAASKVYSSIESHDKRIEQVKAGEMSPEEAHKKQRNARWQDAASIGIAALGIKGAISEWNEVSEEHKEHMEMLAKQEEHHKKRLEHKRRLTANQHGGYYKGRDGQWYYDGPEPQHSERRQLDGPRDGERKLLEGPRSRDDYDDDSYYNAPRSQSRYGRDRSRARSTYTDTRSRSRYDRDRDYSDDDYSYSTRTGGNRSSRSRYDSEY